ncbi:MAG TPA: DUF535 family protein [Gemmatales bacterium]|nr:DUF535 family protein [Gemmatales bacterium]
MGAVTNSKHRIRDYQSLSSRLVDLLLRETRSSGLGHGLVTFAAAARALPYVRMNHEFFSLPLVLRYLDAPDDINHLFYVRHRHYLCMGLTIRERIAAALSHYQFEDNHHDATYLDSVYRDGGLPLWRCRRADTDYTILLKASIKDRQEGGTSIVLMAGDKWLAEMSYAWVDSALIDGGTSKQTVFITRNQSCCPDAVELKQFRQDFPQHSPPYFCLAAMQGIALVHQQSTLAGIRCERQIAYLPRYHRSFHRSYDEFWQSFGGYVRSSRAYAIPLPLTVRPLETVAAKHRTRAAERRAQWIAITENTMTSLNCHVKKPIDLKEQFQLLSVMRTGPGEALPEAVLH